MVLGGDITKSLGSAMQYLGQLFLLLICLFVTYLSYDLTSPKWKKMKRTIFLPMAVFWYSALSLLVLTLMRRLLPLLCAP